MSVNMTPAQRKYLEDLTHEGTGFIPSKLFGLLREVGLVEAVERPQGLAEMGRGWSFCRITEAGRNRLAAPV